jgi:hypothetical protein
MAIRITLLYVPKTDCPLAPPSLRRMVNRGPKTPDAFLE